MPNTPSTISFDPDTVEEGSNDRNGKFIIEWGEANEPPLVSGYQLCQEKDGQWEQELDCPKFAKTILLKDIQDSEKLANGSYRYKVRTYAKAGAYYQYGDSWKISPTIVVNRLPSEVSNFTQPSAFEIEDEFFPVAWSAPVGAFDPIDDYGLEWSINGAGFTAVPGSSALNGGKLSLSIELPQGTEGTYKFRARAHNSLGWGPWTNSANQKEVFVNIAYDSPEKPAFFDLPKSSDFGDYTIDWLTPHGVITYFELEEERRNDPSAPPNCQTVGDPACWKLVATTEESVTKFDFSGRVEDKYRYRVRACNPDDCSEWVTGAWINVYNLENIVPAVGFTPANSAGSTPYDASVNYQGDAIVSIPVEAAPGIAGLEPSIGIVYSGARYRQRQNEVLPEDILGYGWRLSGFSEIRRCVINRPNEDTILLNTSDSLCLDGEPLVLVSGTHWQDGARYRTLRESFQRIELKGNDGSHWFRVNGPDGSLREYGATENSRLKVEDSPDFAWSLNRRNDSFGNTVVYNYHRSTVQGINYPLEILYGDNGDTRIEFEYGTRTDAPPQPLTHSEITQEQLVLLHHINVYRDWNGSAGTLVRDYRLITEEEPADPEEEHHRRLTQIQLCGYDLFGSNAECLQPLDFMWMATGEAPHESIDSKMGIERVTDSLGKVTIFEHTLMVDNTSVGPEGGLFTERPFGSEIPPNEAQPLKPIDDEYRYVVTKVSRSNGIGGMHDTEYRYQGVGYISDNNWGFLGYAAQKVHDLESDLVTYRQFRLDFPFFGKVARLQQYEGNFGSHEQVLTAQQFVHSDLVLDGGASNTHYPAIIESLETTYEWDQTQLQEQILGYRLTTNLYGKTTYGADGELISGAVRTQKIVTSANVSSSQSIWGEVHETGVSGIQRSTQVTTSFNNRTGSNWLIGFVSGEDVRHFDGDTTEEPDQVQIATAEPFGNSNKFDQITRFPGDENLELIVDYGYDAQGNLNSETTSGAHIESRTVTASSFLNKRFPQTVTNTLQQPMTLDYDLRFGSATSVTDANSRSVTITYDAFGREVTRTNADLVTFTSNYTACTTGSCMDGGVLAALKVHTESPITPATDRYYDKLGRVVRQYMASFGGGQRIRQEFDYDPLGRQYLATLPFYENEEKLFTTYGFDIRNRVIHVNKANGGDVDIEFNPLSASKEVQVITKEKVYASVAAGGSLLETQETHRFFNLAGDLVKSIDGVGALDPTAGPVSTDYEYYGSGQPKSVIVDNNLATESSFTYYNSGRRASLTDPNLGTVASSYDALGQLVEQTDNKGQLTSFVYDKLGRLTQQSDADGGVAEWHYDPANGVGALDYRNYTLGGTEIFRESYQYNTQAKLDTLTSKLTAGGETRNYQHSYTYYGTADGRLKDVIYPGGSKAHYSFSGAYLSSITDGQDELKTFTRVNAFGQAEEEVYGNAVVTTRSYDPATGLLESIDSSHGGSQIQDNEYRWRSNGTLESRITYDGGINKQESFSFDALNRLTEAETFFDGASQRRLSTQYDTLGNIFAKTSSHPNDTNVTAYQYGEFGNAGPNAVSNVNINGRAYSLYYNLNGAITHYDAVSGNDKWISWNARQLPIEIVVGDTQVTQQPEARDRFQYGPNGQRYYRETSWWDETEQTVLTEKAFILGNYEDQLPANDPVYTRIQKTNLDTNVVHIIATDNLAVDIAFYEYVHRDHLGSVEKLTYGDNGSIIDLHTAFDPDGKRRSPDWSEELQQTDLKQLLEKQQLTTRRGFTGHEHLDRTGLIHMNGRIYDPTLGRFLSPDPIVQAPSFSQSWNRYTYVFNSPLTYFDPTGHKSNDAEIKCVGDSCAGKSGGDAVAAGLAGGNGGASRMEHVFTEGRPPIGANLNSAMILTLNGSIVSSGGSGRATEGGGSAGGSLANGDDTETATEQATGAMEEVQACGGGVINNAGDCVAISNINNTGGIFMPQECRSDVCARRSVTFNSADQIARHMTDNNRVAAAKTTALSLLGGAVGGLSGAFLAATATSKGILADTKVDYAYQVGDTIIQEIHADLVTSFHSDSGLANVVVTQTVIDNQGVIISRVQGGW